MKKQIAVVFAAAAMAFAAGPQTFTGVITDNMCANADHTDMKMGNDAKCVIDRKSTRLNSSHLGISYAVFCLKQKNLTDPEDCLIGVGVLFVVTALLEHLH